MSPVTAIVDSAGPAGAIFISGIITQIKPFFEVEVKPENPLHDPLLRVMAFILGIAGSLFNYFTSTSSINGADFRNAVVAGALVGAAAIANFHFVSGSNTVSPETAVASVQVLRGSTPVPEPATVALSDIRPMNFTASPLHVQAGLVEPDPSLPIPDTSEQVPVTIKGVGRFVFEEAPKGSEVTIAPETDEVTAFESSKTVEDPSTYESAEDLESEDPEIAELSAKSSWPTEEESKAFIETGEPAPAATDESKSDNVVVELKTAETQVVVAEVVPEVVPEVVLPTLVVPSVVTSFSSYVAGNSASINSTG
jgi:hypothetical protein